MRSDDSDQVLYAQETVARLWPGAGPPRITRRPAAHGPDDNVQSWYLVPNPRHPTMLVPSGVPQASRMLERHGQGIVPHLVRGGLAKAIQTGLLGWTPMLRMQVATRASADAHPSDSVLRHITASLPGVRYCGLILGTPRLNRKPVLQLFAGDGSTVGFAKVGVTAATRQLVQTEAANLELVGGVGMRLIEVPRILHFGTFNDADVLVLSPMTSSQERRESPIPIPAMRELAQVFATGSEPLLSSAYWRELEREVGASAHVPGAARTEDLMRLAAERWGTAHVDLGSWHGDWAPWNMGHHGDLVQLWDWERFSYPVPIGFDAIHFLAQKVRHERPDTGQREAALESQVESLLMAMGSPLGAREPRLVLALYLMTLSVRFAQMAADSQSPVLHPRARWAINFADRLLAGGSGSAFRVS